MNHPFQLSLLESVSRTLVKGIHLPTSSPWPTIIGSGIASLLGVIVGGVITIRVGKLQWQYQRKGVREDRTVARREGPYVEAINRAIDLKGYADVATAARVLGFGSDQYLIPFPGQVRAQIETFGSEPTKKLLRSVSNQYFDWRGKFEGYLSLRKSLTDSGNSPGNAELIQQSIEAYESLSASRGVLLDTIDSFVNQAQPDL